MKKDKEKIKGMGKDELLKKLALLQENVRMIKFKMEGSRSKNVKELMVLKKEIARILTQVNSVKGRQA